MYVKTCIKYMCYNLRILIFWTQYIAKKSVKVKIDIKIDIYIEF